MCTPFHLVDVEILYKISENLLVVLRDKSVDHHREYDLSSEDHQSPKVMANQSNSHRHFRPTGQDIDIAVPWAMAKTLFLQDIDFQRKKRKEKQKLGLRALIHLFYYLKGYWLGLLSLRDCKVVSTLKGKLQYMTTWVLF